MWLALAWLYQLGAGRKNRVASRDWVLMFSSFKPRPQRLALMVVPRHVSPWAALCTLVGRAERYVAQALCGVLAEDIFPDSPYANALLLGCNLHRRCRPARVHDAVLPLLLSLILMFESRRMRGPNLSMFF